MPPEIDVGTLGVGSRQDGGRQHDAHLAEIANGAASTNPFRRSKHDFRPMRLGILVSD